ncbi:hypothetical protein N7526_000020 [Penicillium atrosanguineum]|nr:hypothetical protein N7526_000020 [Penicillium atrosanguineum]
MAADGPKPGFLGNINQEQEGKLQRLWSILLKSAEMPSGDESSNESSNGCVEEHASPTQPQRRSSLLGRTQSNISDKSAPKATSVYQQKLMAYLRELGIKPQETKQVEKALSEINPTELRNGVLDTLKHDHPDAMLLRFLRARKWDVPESEMHVDDEVMAKGELHALKQERSSNAADKKAGKDFLAQMRMGKSYVHGTDKLGRPIVVIRVRLHKPGAQSEEALERYIVHVIESVRLTLSPPVETAAVLFDMTGFSLSNMDTPPLTIFSFKFAGVWRLIKGWMDPDIAAKVQFTNSAADLEKFIARDQLLEEVGGAEKWKYEYIEPKENENAIMEDTTTRDALVSERQQIGEEFLAATSEWNEATKSNDKSKIQSAESQRAYLAERLRVNHWKLDPYARARLCLDRMGVIQKDGKIDFYPNETVVEEKPQETSKTSGTQHLESVNGNGAQVFAS